MAPKKTTTIRRRLTRSAAVQPPSLYHYLDALLHSMRSIAQYEDALCELSHELKRTGVLSPEISEELLEMLDKIPSHDYVLDIEAVRAALLEVKPARKPTPKKSAKSVSPKKRSAVAKKKTGRKSSR